MQDNGICFIVASGNQRRILSRCFDYHPDVFHITKNGALVAAGDEVLYTAPFVPADLDAVSSLSVELPGVFVLVCCVSTTYAPRTSGPDVVTVLGRYYANLELVDDWGRVEGSVFKLVLGRPGEETAGLLEWPRAGLPAGAAPTSSGHGSIGITPVGANKEVALVWPDERVGVSLDDMVAFDDGGSDVEMLEQTGTGIAADNAPEAVKGVSDGTTRSSSPRGVLAWFEGHPGLAN